MKDGRNLSLFRSQSTNQEKQLHVPSNSNPNKFEEEFIKVLQVFLLRGNSEQVFTTLHGQDRVIPAFSVLNFFVRSFFRSLQPSPSSPPSSRFKS